MSTILNEWAGIVSDIIKAFIQQGQMTNIWSQIHRLKNTIVVGNSFQILEGNQANDVGY